MTDTYTAVGLIKQSTGSNSGSWGTELNTNEDITTLLVGGVSNQTITVGDVTPANVNGTADAGKCLTFVCTGVLTGNRNLILPTEARQYIVSNGCTGAFTLTVKTAAGTGVVVPQGGTVLLYCDATNILSGLNTIGIGSGTVALGGTGQDTFTDGQLLIGNSTGNTLTKASLTAGSGISITPGNGSISIAATGGGGTVTSVSVTTANGVSGTVATSTTTPAITLALGDVTPSNVTLATGGALRTTTTSTNTALIQAYDVDGTAYKTFATLTSANTPLMAFTQPSGGTLTWDGGAIGATTPPAIQGYRPANVQTGTTYTFVLTDAGEFVSLSNGSAITLTIPTNASVAFPVGTEIDIAQLGAGQVTVTPAGGVTMNSYTSLVKLAGQYAGATLKQTAANVWLLVGNLA